MTACAEQEKPLIVLVDLSASRAKVPEAIGRLRKNPATSHLPVIAFADEKEQALQTAARDAGGDFGGERGGDPVASRTIFGTGVAIGPALTMSLPVVKLNQGHPVMHLFYRIDRARWVQGDAVGKLEALCAVNKHPSHPRLLTYANVGGKADLAFMLQAAELGQLGQMHRDLEACFAPGTLVPIFSYLSVTELSEYMPTEDDNRQMLIQQEKLAPESEGFQTRMAELGKKRAEYEQYRLYPNCPTGKSWASIR